MFKIEVTDPDYALKTAVQNALYKVVDPELNINIIDLGLVYNITIKNNVIDIIMTLSTRSCPMGGMITAHAKIAVEDVCPGYTANALLVWEPKWNSDMVTQEGKAALGW
jgi:metal-sulfur cluster biosynthetic enzyme